MSGRVNFLMAVALGFPVTPARTQYLTVAAK